MKLGTVAAAVSAVNGFWLIVAGLFWNQAFSFINPTAQTIPSSDNLVLSLLGAIILLDSIVCFLGWSKAFYVSAAASVLGILGVAAGGVQLASPSFVVSALLCLLTAVLDVVAARRKTFVPEADHPLNLPVFG